MVAIISTFGISSLLSNAANILPLQQNSKNSALINWKNPQNIFENHLNRSDNIRCTSKRFNRISTVAHINLNYRWIATPSSERRNAMLTHFRTKCKHLIFWANGRNFRTEIAVLIWCFYSVVLNLGKHNEYSHFGESISHVSFEDEIKSCEFHWNKTKTVE